MLSSKFYQLAKASQYQLGYRLLEGGVELDSLAAEGMTEQQLTWFKAGSALNALN